MVLLEEEPFDYHSLSYELFNIQHVVVKLLDLDLPVNKDWLMYFKQLLE